MGKFFIPQWPKLKTSPHLLVSKVLSNLKLIVRPKLLKKLVKLNLTPTKPLVVGMLSKIKLFYNAKKKAQPIIVISLNQIFRRLFLLTKKLIRSKNLFPNYQNKNLLVIKPTSVLMITTPIFCLKI